MAKKKTKTPQKKMEVIRRKSGVDKLQIPVFNWGEAFVVFIVGFLFMMVISYYVFEYITILTEYGSEFNTYTAPLDVKWGIFLTNLPTIITISLAISLGIGVLVGFAT